MTRIFCHPSEYFAPANIKFFIKKLYNIFLQAVYVYCLINTYKMIMQIFHRMDRSANTLKWIIKFCSKWNKCYNSSLLLIFNLTNWLEIFFIQLDKNLLCFSFIYFQREKIFTIIHSVIDLKNENIHTYIVNPSVLKFSALDSITSSFDNRRPARSQLKNRRRGYEKRIIFTRWEHLSLRPGLQWNFKS